MTSPLEIKLQQLAGLMGRLDLVATMRLIAVLDDIRARAIARAAMLSGEQKPPGSA